jgi:hypothetical protein
MDAWMQEWLRYGGLEVWMCVCVVDWFWYQLWGWAAPMLWKKHMLPTFWHSSINTYLKNKCSKSKQYFLLSMGNT